MALQSSEDSRPIKLYEVFLLSGVQQIIALCVFVAAWQFLSGRYINDYFISSPSAISHRAFGWLLDGTILRHVTSTVAITLGGFAAAAVVAVPLALIVSSSKWADMVFGPFVYAAYSMPKIVLGPALVLWLGIGPQPAIALSAITSFFLIFYNLYVGLKQIPPIFGVTAKLLNASKIQTALKFRLPAAGPFLATGLSQGLIYAFHGAMVGEMTASNVGVGYLILFSGSRLDSTGVMTGLLLIGLIALGLVRTLSAIVEYLGGGNDNPSVG